MIDWEAPARPAVPTPHTSTMPSLRNTRAGTETTLRSTIVNGDEERCLRLCNYDRDTVVSLTTSRALSTLCVLERLYERTAVAVLTDDELLTLHYELGRYLARRGLVLAPAGNAESAS